VGRGGEQVPAVLDDRCPGVGLSHRPAQGVGAGDPGGGVQGAHALPGQHARTVGPPAPVGVGDEPRAHVGGGADHPARAVPEPVRLVGRERVAEEGDVAASTARQVQVRVDGGAVVHAQRGEDPLAQVVGEGPPADHLDQAGGDLRVGVVVLPPRPGLGGQAGAAQVGHGLAQGAAAPAPAVGGELGVGHAGGLVEQLSHGDPLRPGVGHRELGQVLPDGVVQVELPGLGQLQDRERGDRLAQRGHGHGRVLGDGLPLGGRAVPPRVHDLRAPGQDHRRAGQAGGLPVLLHQRVDGGGGRGPGRLRPGGRRGRAH
jgi:hypothetical protein